jgi:hypothetical protein
MADQALTSHSERDETGKRRVGGARGQLSEQRAKWVRVFARTGLAKYAAEQAGYSHPDTEAHRLMNDPKVIKAVLEARQTFVEGELGGLAFAELKNLITDRERTPASVRFAACKWVLETAGHGQADMMSDSGKALADMTLAELGAFIKQGDKVLAGLQSATIQGTAERVNSTNEQQTDLVTRLEVADLLG